MLRELGQAQWEQGRDHFTGNSTVFVSQDGKDSHLSDGKGLVPLTEGGGRRRTKETNTFLSIPQTFLGNSPFLEL